MNSNSETQKQEKPNLLFLALIALLLFITTPLSVILIDKVGYSLVSSSDKGFLATLFIIIIPAFSLILAIFATSTRKGKFVAIFTIILNILWFLIITSLPNMISGGRHPGTLKLCRCEVNLRNLGLATEMYMKDHEGEYPVEIFDLLKEGYILYINGTICPETNNEYIFKIIKSTDSQHFEIYCPNPQEHETFKGKYDEIKYIENKGQDSIINGEIEKY